MALVTPFDSDGAIDQASLARHVESQIEGGVEFLVPCGTTGESATMAAEEQLAVISTVVEVAEGRVGVMAGADAILSVSPYYNKPTQSGLYAHYEAIAAAVESPVFVYNVPGRTASNVAPETLLRLAEIDNIAGVKEASGDLGQVASIIAGRPNDFLVISGDDELTVPMLSLGGDGVISVVANEAPRIMSDLVRAGLNGDFKAARQLHYRLLPLIRANFIETNPIPVKTALEMMDRMPAHFRLPLVPLLEANRAALRDALQAAELL